MTAAGPPQLLQPRSKATAHTHSQLQSLTLRQAAVPTAVWISEAPALGGGASQPHLLRNEVGQLRLSASWKQLCLFKHEDPTVSDWSFIQVLMKMQSL